MTAHCCTSLGLPPTNKYDYNLGLEVHSGDLPSELVKELEQVAAKAIKESQEWAAVALAIKNHFDQAHGPNWFCVVGKDFGITGICEVNKGGFVTIGAEVHVCVVRYCISNGGMKDPRHNAANSVLSVRQNVYTDNTEAHSIQHCRNKQLTWSGGITIGCTVAPPLSPNANDTTTTNQSALSATGTSGAVWSVVGGGGGGEEQEQVAPSVVVVVDNTTPQQEEAAAATAAGSAAASDDEWELGIGHLIIDLDADIEKMSAMQNSSSGLNNHHHHHHHHQQQQQHSMGASGDEPREKGLKMKIKRKSGARFETSTTTSVGDDNSGSVASSAHHSTTATSSSSSPASTSSLAAAATIASDHHHQHHHSSSSVTIISHSSGNGSTSDHHHHHHHHLPRTSSTSSKKGGSSSSSGGGGGANSSSVSGSAATNAAASSSSRSSKPLKTTFSSSAAVATAVSSISKSTTPVSSKSAMPPLTATHSATNNGIIPVLSNCVPPSGSVSDVANGDMRPSGVVEKRDCGVLCTSVATITEPDNLGPCEPGSSVLLEGIVWQETDGGVLVVNVTWRGKTYVGTLLDATRHDWAPPRFGDDDRNSEDCGVGGAGGGSKSGGSAKGGRGKRNTRSSNSTDSVNNNNTAATAATSGGGGGSTSAATDVGLSKLRNGKGRRSFTPVPPSPIKSGSSVPSPGPSDSNDSKKGSSSKGGAKRDQTPDVVGTAPASPEAKKARLLHPPTPSSSPPPSPVLIECPEPNCSKKYKHLNGLKYHQSHAHSQQQQGSNVTTSSVKDTATAPISADHDDSGVFTFTNVKNASTEEKTTPLDSAAPPLTEQGRSGGNPLSPAYSDISDDNNSQSESTKNATASTDDDSTTPDNKMASETPPSTTGRGAAADDVIASSPAAATATAATSVAASSSVMTKIVPSQQVPKSVNVIPEVVVATTAAAAPSVPSTTTFFSAFFNHRSSSSPQTTTTSPYRLPPPPPPPSPSSVAKGVGGIPSSGDIKRNTDSKPSPFFISHEGVKTELVNTAATNGDAIVAAPSTADLVSAPPFFLPPPPTGAYNIEASVFAPAAASFVHHHRMVTPPPPPNSGSLKPPTDSSLNATSSSAPHNTTPSPVGTNKALDLLQQVSQQYSDNQLTTRGPGVASGGGGGKEVVGATPGGGSSPSPPHRHLHTHHHTHVGVTYPLYDPYSAAAAMMAAPVALHPFVPK